MVACQSFTYSSESSTRAVFIFVWDVASLYGWSSRPFWSLGKSWKLLVYHVATRRSFIHNVNHTSGGMCIAIYLWTDWSLSVSYHCDRVVFAYLVYVYSFLWQDANHNTLVSPHGFLLKKWDVTKVNLQGVAALISDSHHNTLWSFIYSTAILYWSWVGIKFSGCSLNLLKQHQSLSSLLVELLDFVRFTK